MDGNVRLRKLLKRPLQTEKVVKLQETQNTYTFEVPRETNKIEIKRAIESLFDVSVVNVRTISVHGKMKRLGRFEGYQKSWKKALVTLKSGDTLDLFENV